MFYLDGLRGKYGGDIYRTRAGFRYPLSKDRSGRYKVKSGEMLRVCMTSDFFLEDADPWRPEAWDIIARRRDVKFFLLTKRPERIESCLPPDWGQGWENVMMNVTAENQRRADERLPILLSLPCKHRGVMCAPFIGPVSLRKYLETGLIEQVLADGENYAGDRPLDFDWVKTLRQECVENRGTFAFLGTGRRFIKDGRLYRIEGSETQSRQAYLSGMSWQGRPMRFKLYDELGRPIPEERLYRPRFRDRCQTCGMRLTCNGCSDCGACKRGRKGASPASPP